ncbi:hypothetical protein C0993_009228 [Termitomyces sp. T159_Od127]|nr:hypothetical protein C0993_009228 [Termitomyces sp. T159_Od127]
MDNARQPTAESLLIGLNPAQLEGRSLCRNITGPQFDHSDSAAVQFTPDVPIQILAGPGSGKTRLQQIQSNASRKILATIIKAHKDYMEEKGITLTENGVQSMISKAKAKGQTPNDVLRKAGVNRSRSANAPPDPNDGPRLNQIEYIVGLTYEQYELTLRRNNSLDFDDLLLYGVRLFDGFKQTVSWCKYVLVDEL